MKRSMILVAEFCAVILFAAAIYVFAPVVKSRVEAKWMPKPQPVTEPPQTISRPIPKPSPTITTAIANTPEPKGQGDPEQEAKSAAAWEARQPQTFTKTYAFAPGQAMNFPNRTFRKVEIRAEYPIRVLTGRCHNDYALEFSCEDQPGDIFITDTRRMPVFTTPRANSVTVTVTEF